VSTYRAEPTWWDDGRNEDGSPRTRKVWTIEGPEPFGGLTAKDEEQAETVAKRLNETHSFKVSRQPPADLAVLRQAVAAAESDLLAASQYRDEHDWLGEHEEADRRWQLACEASAKLDAAKRALLDAEVIP
jgi:hypothetical protein